MSPEYALQCFKAEALPRKVPPKLNKVPPIFERTGFMSSEEMEYIRTRITPEHPLCWFCLFRPASPATTEYCDHKPLPRIWRNAAKKKDCDAFLPDGDRVGLRKEEKLEQREQLELDL